MPGISVERPPAAPNPGANTEQAAEMARQGQVGNRSVSTSGGGSVGPIREGVQVDSSTVATPISERSVSLVPEDDPTTLPISWFTERLPSGTGPNGTPRDAFPLVFESEALASDMKNVVHFAEEIDKDILRASELLEKSDYKPLNEKEQQEVSTLLNAGKYNLEQVQRWTAVTRNQIKDLPTVQEFMTKLQERLADRHMDLADLMCLYDLDQVPPEAVSHADRIGHNLVAVDASLKVAEGLTISGLSGEAKQQIVEALESHRAILGQVQDVVIGRTSADSAQVVSKAVWNTPFNLTKGKQAGGDFFLKTLHKHWDAKAAGAAGNWLPPLARYKVTEEEMLQDFVGYQLKQAGVAKENMPDLKFQFKKATVQALNERPWEPIEKELHYAVAGESRTVHSKITPAKAMASRFAKDIPANGISCGDRMQHTHVPNLARTELTDASGKTLFSALRHGVLDAYDISASSLRKLPDQALIAMVKDLLVPRGSLLAPPEIPPQYSDKAWVSTQSGNEVDIATTDATIQRNDNNQIAYLGKFQNTCPEECAVFVANHFDLDCKFDTYKNTEQIDIFLPISIHAPEPEMGRPVLFTDGKSAESCFNYLQGLDKNSVYLMRTGQNNLSGHNQMLYSKDNEWYAYDSVARQSQLTSGASLTASGNDRLVKKYATWGAENGETSISTVQVTKEGARDLISFIKDSRNEGVETAMGRLWARDPESAVQPRSSADVGPDSRIVLERIYADVAPDSKVIKDGSVDKTTADTEPVARIYGDGDYATIESVRPREVPPDVPPPYSDDAWESTLDTKEVLAEFWSDPEPLPVEDVATAIEDPYMDMDMDMDIDMGLGGIDAPDSDREQQVNQIVSEIRMDKTKAAKHASEMRTAASQNMAKELAVATLVGNPDKLRAALDGETVNLNLSSISLLTPDRIRSVISPKSNERAMLRRQTEALKNLGGTLSLQVRDDLGELRTVKVNCKVRTFNFGVNAGAVGRAKHIPSHTRGWDKLMGWGYAMELNNPQLRTLLGDPRSAVLGGEVQDKLTELESKTKILQAELPIMRIAAPRNSEIATKIPELERELAATTLNLNTLRDAAKQAKQIWREGSYNKGGQDPYKMVSRLGMVINEMGETLAFNCKSGKDRTGQLDAELKYLAALNSDGYLPDPGAPVTPQLRQVRSDFTLNTGNLEMQRMNTGLPGFKLDTKTVPGLANYIAGPEMESMYRGGSAYIKS